MSQATHCHCWDPWPVPANCYLICNAPAVARTIHAVRLFSLVLTQQIFFVASGFSLTAAVTRRRSSGTRCACLLCPALHAFALTLKTPTVPTTFAPQYGSSSAPPQTLPANQLTLALPSKMYSRTTTMTQQSPPGSRTVGSLRESQ